MTVLTTFMNGQCLSLYTPDYSALLSYRMFPAHQKNTGVFLFFFFLLVHIFKSSFLFSRFVQTFASTCTFLVLSFIPALLALHGDPGLVLIFYHIVLHFSIYILVSVEKQSKLDGSVV
ncbi:hypothetical protein QBC43DRAFT_309560, partial [Cladorrhinum sp. PSN259]